MSGNNHVKYCGIYKIRNTQNQKVYIGSSSNIKTRWRQHRYQLKKGEHHSTYLQRSWNKHGQESFAFEIIEQCSKEVLKNREQHYIDTLAPGYNENLIAHRPPSFNELSPELQEQVREKKRATAHRRIAEGTAPSMPKPIKRICILTKETKEYTSAEEAVQEGFSQQSISACCLHKKNTYANYYWRFVGDNTPLPKVKRLQFIPIVRISSEGKKLYTTRQSIINDGFSYDSVKRVSRGNRGRRSYKGFQWKYENAQADQFTQTHPTHQEKFTKAVVRIDSQNNEKRYVSQAEASKDGFDQRKVSLCCLGKRKTHGGFEWRFA